MSTHRYFVTTPKALEAILANELAELGAQNIRETVAGVSFDGELEIAYNVCLWSRVANRVLLVLDAFRITSQEELYRGIYKINWFEHMRADNSFAVSFHAKNSPVIRNTHFGALKVKDAIVDQMRNKFQKRPVIDIRHPDVRIHVYLQNDTAQVSLDLSGDSLHRRGYRDINIKAPIKENLAAAMLIRSQWSEIAKQGGTLLDPMCGSGTLLLEGALIAADYAPGLLTRQFGFSRWKQHDPDCWQKLIKQAELRKAAGIKKLPTIVGFDQNRHTMNAALQHIANAGLQNYIHIERRDIKAAKPAESWQPGLVICNPPYGERLGEQEEISGLYQQFGHVLKNHFVDWQATMIISNPELGFRLGIRSKKPITLYNGAIECKLLRMDILEKNFFVPKAKTQQQRLHEINATGQILEEQTGAEMFANRLRKNLKKITKWARREQIHCYRIYDADLPEYAVAVDIYHGEKIWVNVQEYEAPKSIDQAKANQRLAGVLAEIPKVLNINKDQVSLKIRRKQKHTDQYDKQADSRRFHIVEEGPCKFLVNFEDYLDTGLFLDHRPVRFMIQQQSKAKRFLNLFAYTGAATVHAAMGGAKLTTTVDMSKTYLDWAKQNLALNQIKGEHEIIRADCMEWLAQEAKRNQSRQYDLIFLDPPTFSNSKRMDSNFDIQTDHVKLITDVIELLAPGGVLYFSTNFRRFKLDTTALSDLTVEDISEETIPEDFKRNQRIHYCWRIQE
jgi:23S rRNA (guanine2445-N2)-methyltransferase / 23S rRNA (guanine2069-N7)-methyltransferase